MSIAVDQALENAWISGDFEMDTVFDNGVYRVFDDPGYTNHVGTYSPTNGRAYAEITIFDAGTEPFDLSDHNERLGAFQVILRYPVNTGAFTAKSKADEIFNHFSIGSRHTYSGQSVEIISNDRGPSAAEEGWHKVNLRMNYRAFITR